jgi:hypothetical protein
MQLILQAEPQRCGCYARPAHFVRCHPRQLIDELHSLAIDRRCGSAFGGNSYAKLANADPICNELLIVDVLDQIDSNWGLNSSIRDKFAQV